MTQQKVITTTGQSACGSPKLITPAQTKLILNLKNVDTLSVWRSTRRYEDILPYVKIGRNVRYRLDDVLRFIELRTIGGVK